MTELAENKKLTLSIVMPVLNECSALAEILNNVKAVGADQVIIVDGGSDDGTYEWLTKNWQDPSQQHIVLQGEPGRAVQMNLGAAINTSDVLLFLHADTLLPDFAEHEVNLARNQQRLWGRFDIRFSTNSWPMSVIAFFINIRSRLTGIATGDQALFIDAELFKLIGGFNDIPLMEDVAISKQLKQHCRPYCSRLKVSTSARRWQKNGIISTVLLMWKIRLAFFFGISPTSLANSYRNVR